MGKKGLLYLMILIYCCNFSQAISQGVNEQRYTSGQKLYSTYCGSCHGIHKEMLGPMLASINNKRPKDWLFRFIKNSQKVILSEDKYAKDLYLQYNQVVMPSFEYLSQKEIEDILYYIDVESDIPTDHAKLELPEFELDYEKEGGLIKGRELFESQCYPCHKVHWEDKAPALGSVNKRHSFHWLLQFIKNSKEVVNSGDEYAKYIDNAFEIDMINFEHLSNEDIVSILRYIEYESSSPPPVAGVNGKKIISDRKYLPLAKEVVYEPDTIAIIFIIISLLGASVHIYLIYRLFIYLYRKKYK